MEFSCIYAVSSNRVIGNEGKLPWRCTADLHNFKKITKGGVVIMGRKTWESLGCRPLVDRVNIVITKDDPSKDKYKDCLVEQSIAGAVLRAIRCKITAPTSQQKAFFIGGKKIIEMGMEYSRTIHETLILGDYEGDVTIPEVNTDHWYSLSVKHHRIEGNPIYAYRTWIRYPTQ